MNWAGKTGWHRHWAGLITVNTCSKSMKRLYWQGGLQPKMIILHELTHVLDHLLIECFLEPETYYAWLYAHITQQTVIGFQTRLVVPSVPMVFSECPSWWDRTHQDKAQALIQDIIKQPYKYFEFEGKNAPQAPTTKLLNRILGEKLGNVMNLEQVFEHFMGVYYLYQCSYHACYGLINSSALNDVQ
jgi:hypothetical protein